MHAHHTFERTFSHAFYSDDDANDVDADDNENGGWLMAYGG